MLITEKSYIKGFIDDNKNMFEKVSQSIDRNNRKMVDAYTILNYGKIMKEMKAFVTGYIDYRAKNDDKYKNNALSTAIQFYDNMFDKKDYRKDIILMDMPDINRNFLIDTKDLKNVLESAEKLIGDDYVLEQLIILSYRQYKKISKVYKDDSTIYLWLSTMYSRGRTISLSSTLTDAFYNKTTPVMHEK